MRIVGVNEKSRRQEGHFVCWDTWGWWYIFGVVFSFIGLSLKKVQAKIIVQFLAIVGVVVTSNI